MRRQPILRNHQTVLIRSRRRVEKLPLVPVDLHKQDAEGDGIREDFGAGGLFDSAGEVRPEVQALRPCSVPISATETPTAPNRTGSKARVTSKGEFGERESEAYVDWGQVGGGCAVIEDLDASY